MKDKEQTTIEETMATETAIEATETKQETAVEVTPEQVTDQVTEKPNRRNRKRKEEATEIIVEEPSELDQLKQQLAEMEQMKKQLEEEKNDLSKTVAELQEEVKITPQKIGQAIKQMGISPLSVSRETQNQMTIEAYNSMSDSQRRDWQRKNRADFLEMMHRVKIS